MWKASSDGLQPARSAKNHVNGLGNPHAHMRKDFGFDFCSRVSEKNPLVAGPLRRTAHPQIARR